MPLVKDQDVKNLAAALGTSKLTLRSIGVDIRHAL